MTPSPYQQTILDFLRSNPTTSVIIEAVAGSGKTTAILMALSVIPKDRASVFLAFNKNIQEELNTRLPFFTKAYTFHALCMATLNRCRPETTLVKDKCRLILEKLIPAFPRRKPIQDDVLRLVSYAKSAGHGFVADCPSLHQLVETHDLYNRRLWEVIEVADQVLIESNADRSTMDFDDALLYCLEPDVRFNPYYTVFIDEAQDTNSVQRLILRKLLHPKGRLIAVGDPAQAIYMFRGADHTALDLIREDFQCTSLPLSVSYRCAQSVVREAKEYQPAIEPHPDAPMGLVVKQSTYDTYDFKPDSAVVCRNNAPLVAFAMSAARRHLPCRILGRDIGASYIKLLKSFKVEELPALTDELNRWYKKEKDDIERSGKLFKLDALDDKYQSLLLFISNSSNFTQLLDMIQDLFNDDDSSKLTLATVHKSKGLEWESVFILDKDSLMPSKYAQTPAALQQEMNLIYVAITRAKLNLFYIKSGCWKESNRYHE